MAIINNLIIVLIGLVILGGAIWLQIFLSKKSSKRLGLVLPIIIFAFSLILAVNIMEPVNANQVWIDEVSSLLLTNIPTSCW